MSFETLLLELRPESCQALVIPQTTLIPRANGHFLSTTHIPKSHNSLTTQLNQVTINGTIGTANSAMFAKYGNTVRVGPSEVLITGAKAVHQVLAQEDFPKSERYTLSREYKHIPNLFNMTDKVAHRARVCLPLPVLTDDELEEGEGEEWC